MSATVACSRRRPARRARGPSAGCRPRPAPPRPGPGSTTRSPGGTRADRAGELGRRRVLEQEAGGARLHRAPQVARPAERRQDRATRHAGQLAAQLARPPRGPSPPGHLDVQQRDVRPRAARAAPSTASPRSTWATTSMSVSSASRLASAPRTIAWSSAISTRITRRLGGTVDVQAEAALGPRRPASSAAAPAPRPARRRPARPLPSPAPARVAAPVVDDLDVGVAPPGAHADRAVARAAVADDVRRCPRGPPRRGPSRRSGGSSTAGSATRRRSRRPRAPPARRELVDERHPPVAADRLAHLAQRLPG